MFFLFYYYQILWNNKLQKEKYKRKDLKEFLGTLGIETNTKVSIVKRFSKEKKNSEKEGTKRNVELGLVMIHSFKFILIFLALGDYIYSLSFCFLLQHILLSLIRFPFLKVAPAIVNFWLSLVLPGRIFLFLPLPGSFSKNSSFLVL